MVHTWKWKFLSKNDQETKMKKNQSENITPCSKKGQTMKTIGTALTRSILRTACTHKGLQTFTKTKKCIDCTEEISGTAYT